MLNSQFSIPIRNRTCAAALLSDENWELVN
jgi:hypothetical protein